MIRNGQNNKRMRGRNNNNNNNNRNNSPSNGGGGNNHNRGHHSNPLTRVYESNGPEVKIRGTAHTVAEKYVQLARDASSSGDHVTAEAHYQHAEHYFRLIAAAQEQFRQQNPNYQPPLAEARDENRDGSFEDGEEGQGQPQANPQNINNQQTYNNQQGGNGGQQNYPPREQPSYPPREQAQNREHSQPRENSYNNNQQNHQPRPQHQQPQPQPHYQPQVHQPQPVVQQPQPQPQPPMVAENRDVGGLPSFITGGQPQIAAPAGDDNQPDRFPLHRRRRRHRGPPNAAQDGAAFEAPDAPTGE